MCGPEFWRRWADSRRDVEAAMASVTGDSLAAAAIAYLGPFDEAYRARLTAEWSAVLAR